MPKSTAAWRPAEDQHPLPLDEESAASPPSPVENSNDATPPTPVTPTEADDDPTEGTAAPTFDDDFDPGEVPLFPVLTAQVTPPGIGEQLWPVSVNGVPVRSAHATTAAEARDAAVQALAGQVRARHVEVCRATLIERAASDSEAEDQRHHFIVGSRGELFDVDAHEAETADADRTRRNRRRMQLGAAAAAVVLLFGGVGTGIALTTQPAAETAAPAPPPPAAEPVQFPAAAPAGLSDQARWASEAAVDEGPVAVTTDGRVVVPSADGLAVLNPSNGKLAGTINSGRVTEGPWALTLGEQNIITWVSSDTLMWVPQSQPATTPATHQLSNSATVVPSAHGLAWTISETRAGLLTEHGPQERTVPADASIVGTSGSSLWAANDLGESWQLTHAGPLAPATLDLAAPNSEAQPEGIIAATNTTIVAAWTAADGSAIYTFHDADYPREAIATTTEPPADDGQQDLTNQPIRPDGAAAGQVPTDPAWVQVRGGLLHLEGDHEWIRAPEGELHAILDDHAWSAASATSTRTPLLDPAAAVTADRTSAPPAPAAQLPDGTVLVFGTNADTIRLYALPAA